MTEDAIVRGDVATRGAMLGSALDTAVAALERPQALVPTLQALGRPHVGYGVQQSHYATVGAALLATLQRRLGHRETAGSVA